MKKIVLCISIVFTPTSYGVSHIPKDISSAKSRDKTKALIAGSIKILEQNKTLSTALEDFKKNDSSPVFRIWSRNGSTSEK